MKNWELIEENKNNVLKHRMGKIASTILKACKQLRMECGEFEPFKAKISIPGNVTTKNRKIFENSWKGAILYNPRFL